MIMISSGMAGTMYARVRKTAIIEGISKKMAVLLLTNRFLK